VRSIVALHVRQITTIRLHAEIVPLREKEILENRGQRTTQFPKRTMEPRTPSSARGSDTAHKEICGTASPDEGVRGSINFGLHGSLLAATAFERESSLATFNKRHFANVKGLRGAGPK
jgi:hypothetical protein